MLKTAPNSFKAGGKRVRFDVRKTGSAVWLSLLPPPAGTVGLGYRWLDSTFQLKSNNPQAFGVHPDRDH
jgi:hypothetical protein